jgi:hypothetical protein
MGKRSMILGLEFLAFSRTPVIKKIGSFNVPTFSQKGVVTILSKIIPKKASEKSLLGFFNKDFSKRSAYDPRTSVSETLLFRRALVEKGRYIQAF